MEICWIHKSESAFLLCSPSFVVEIRFDFARNPEITYASFVTVVLYVFDMLDLMFLKMGLINFLSLITYRYFKQVSNICLNS